MAQGLFEYGSGRKKDQGGMFRSSGKSIFASAKGRSKQEVEDAKEEERLNKQRQELTKKKQEQKPKTLADLAHSARSGAAKVGSFLFSGVEKVHDSVDALSGHSDRKLKDLGRSYDKGEIDLKEYQKRLKAMQEDTKWAGTKDKGTGDRFKKSAGVAIEATADIIPVGKVAKGAKLATRLKKGAMQGAGIAGAGSVGSQLASEGNVDPLQTLADLAAGGIVGGSASGLFGSNKFKEMGQKIKDKIPGAHAAEDVIRTETMAKAGADKRRGMYDTLKTALVDRHAPVKNLVSEIESLTGRKINKGEDPYELMKLRAGVEGQAATHLQDTAEWMKTVPKALRSDGDAYGYAKQFLSQAAKRTPEQLETARNTIAKLEAKYGGDMSVLEDYTKKTRQTFDSLVDLYEREGIISGDHAKNLRANPDYFAKMEVLQDETNRLLRGGSINTKEAAALKGIKGQRNGALLAPSAEAYVKQTATAFQDVANNKVGRAVGKLADELGDDTNLMYRPKSASEKLPKGYTRITYMDNGKPQAVALPKEIGDILTGADDLKFDIVTSTIGKIHNVFRQAVTTYNPLFVFIRNPARDFKSFLTNSRYVPVRRAVWDYSTALMDSLTNGQWKKEFLRAGGGQAGYFAREGGQAGKQIAKAAKEITGKRSIAGRVVTSPRDFMQKMSEAIESAPRVAEFKGALKKGATPEEAAIAGREVTVDFAQGGNVAKVANQWIPFLNARAQGVRRTVKAFRENPKRALAVWAATGVVPMAALMAHNQQNFKEVWNDIPDYEKENNFLMIYGNAKDSSGRYTQIFRFPKGDVDKILGNTFESMLDRFYSENKKNIASELGSALLNGASNASPISFANNGKVSTSSTLSGVLPPVAKAPAQWAANYNFFRDGPVVPENLQGAPVGEQKFDSTPGLAQLIGGFTGTSPLKVETATNDLAGQLPFDVAETAGGSTRTADRFLRGVEGATGGKVETEFWKVYGPAQKTRDYREKQFYKLLDAGKYKEAQRRADEYNRDIDKRFSGYYKQYGPYVPSAFDNGMDPLELIDSLKLDIVVSKKGKPYIKR